MRILLMIALSLSMIMAEATMLKDPQTGLIWEDTAHVTGTKVTNNEAKTYCETLKLGGFENWRLPTIRELITIVDYTRYRPATLKEFKYVSNKKLYWSSTPYAKNSTEFWGVIFKDGTTKHTSAIYERYVRCVRDPK